LAPPLILNATFNCPSVTVAVKVRSQAVSLPQEAKMSNAVSTTELSMRTSKRRWPPAVAQSSIIFSVTW